jgi:hypothetical protein
MVDLIDAFATLEDLRYVRRLIADMPAYAQPLGDETRLLEDMLLYSLYLDEIEAYL